MLKLFFRAFVYPFSAIVCVIAALVGLVALFDFANIPLSGLTLSVVSSNWRYLVKAAVVSAAICAFPGYIRAVLDARKADNTR